jgi:hypothetical protein
MYLTVEDTDDLNLQTKFDRSTVFQVYRKQNNLLGLRSMKRLKYIGISFWGIVKATSAYFSVNEETYIPLDGSPSGLLILNCNWGGGGWVRPNAEGKLCTYTAGIRQRERMAVFRVTRITEEDISKLS